MNKLIYIFTLIFVVNSCSSSSSEKEEEIAQPQQKIAVDSLQQDDIPQLLLTHSGSAQPSTNVKINDINFTIVLKDIDTIHWSTADTNFITPEGYKIGTNWKEISPKYQNSISSMPGWGYYIKLNSDWQLGFCEGSSCTDFPPTDSSNVKWIFKRSK